MRNSTDPTKPYISFIVAGRNDNYGGDFNDRLQNSVNFLAKQVEKHRLPAEYIVVNWNPLPDRPGLREALKWPDGRKFLKFRIITVSNKIHESFRNPEVREPVPLYEYLAKNAGIRRAKADWICAANPDIIYTPEIIEFLAQQRLEKTSYYRADRVDFHKLDLPNGQLPEDLVARLQDASFRVFLKGHRYPIEFKNFFNWRFRRLKRQNQRLLDQQNAEGWTPPEFFYHCNCSGDFMLLHRDYWHYLRGNPERTLVAAHTDAQFVIMAAAAGLKEHVFDYPLYHQNHDRRYSCDEEETNPKVDEMYRRYKVAGQQMLAEGKPLVSNDEYWGLKQHQLEEEEF